VSLERGVCSRAELQVFNLFIVILQRVFRQHNNIRINVLLQHVSTQESHGQADYLRTVNTLYPLQYYTCNFCIRDPICITLCE